MSAELALHVSRQLDQTRELLNREENDWYNNIQLSGGILRNYKGDLERMRDELDAVVLPIKREQLHGNPGDWRDKIDKIDLIGIRNQVTSINRQISMSGGAVQISRSALLAAGVELPLTSTSSRGIRDKSAGAHPASVTIPATPHRPRRWDLPRQHRRDATPQASTNLLSTPPRRLPREGCFNVLASAGNAKDRE